MKQGNFKRKPCLVNVTHNQNSSKNINISINYNLSSPKYPQSLKGRKIQRLGRAIEDQSSQAMKHSIKDSIPGCDISLKLIKKRNQQRLEEKSLIKCRTGKIQKPKKRIEIDFPMTTTSKQGREKRLFTEYEDMKGSKEERQRFNKSTDHIRTKSEPRARLEGDAVKKLKRKEEKALSEEKPKRNKIKSTILDRNRTEADLKDKSKGKKKRDSIKDIPLKQPKVVKKGEKEKQKELVGLKKPSKKVTKRRFFSHIDFEPFLMSKFLNSSVISDQINPSEMPSKQNSSRKSPSQREDTINVFKNTNSIQLVPINQIRKLEREAKIKPYTDQINKRFNYDKAADKIKHHWRQYHTKKIIRYYNSVFQKNSKSEYFQQLSDIDSKSEHNNKGEEQENDINIKELIEFKKDIDSPTPDEQDTYFDIKKYQKMVEKTLEQDSKQKIAESKSSSKGNSRTNSPRNKKDNVQQVEQWDNINKLLKSQFNRTSTQADESNLLNQLMKQSQYNRKWIEDGSPQHAQDDRHEFNKRIDLHSRTYEYDEGISSRIEQLMNAELMNNSESEGNMRIINQMKGEDIDNYLDCGLESCGLQNIYDQGSNNLDREQDRDMNSQPSIKEVTEDNNSEQQSPGRMFDSSNHQLPPQSHPQRANDFHSLNKYNTHLAFQQVYNILLNQLCDQILAKPKIQKMCKKLMKKMMSQMQSKYSIKTNYIDIKNYIDGLLKYVLESKEQRAITLRNINCVLGPTSKEMLYYLRIDDYEEVEEEEDKEESLFVISLDTFQRYEEVLVKESNMLAKQQMYEHFWHRALFEGLNEALDEHRPYGTYGKPYDWQIVPKLNGKKIKDQELQFHLRQANAKLLEISSYMGGVIPEKQSGQFTGLGLTEDDYEQLNQQRVSRILADELMQQEETWINYLDEKVEIELEMIQLIEETFLIEVGRDLKKIQLRRAFTSDN